MIGHPVAHSRSPAMQNAALQALGLADRWHYGALDIEPSELADRLPELAADPEYVGLNVTVPHKPAALELADSSSPVAREIGAANTLVFDAEGSIHAENTDAPGLIDAIDNPIRGRSALVLGAGGAARAVVWALRSEGARVAIWARRSVAAEELAAQLGGTPWPGDGDAGSFDLVVNASAAGLGDGAALAHLPLESGQLRRGQILVDMVYGAQPTDLTQAARDAGCRVVDGLEILVRQGARSLAIWTARPAPLETMRRAARAGQEPG